MITLETAPDAPVKTMEDVIPRDVTEMRYRLLQKASVDLAIKAKAQRLAAGDPEHFITYFCWTFDPRRRLHMPFWLFPRQAEFIASLELALVDGVDLVVPKNRDMGVSWATLAWVLYHWLFDPGFTCLLGSRNADMVDDLATTDSLFGRLDYLMRKLPDWLMPEGFRWDRHRKEMTLINPANGNTVTGEGSTGNFGRGGRYSAIVLDEFCFWPDREQVDTSTADSSNTRVFISTGDPDGYFEWFLKNTSYRQFEFRYYDHPLKDAAWLERERVRRQHDPEGFDREVLGVRSRGRSGLVYPHLASIPFGPQFQYNGYWPLYTGWDFGLDDTTAILWFANRPGTDKYHVVDAYERGGRRIAFFVPIVTGVMREKPDFHYSVPDRQVIDRHMDWPIAAHYGDPTGKNRSQTTNTSVIDELRDDDVHIRTNDKARDHETRMTRTREFITRVEGFAMPYCEDARDKLLQARYPKERIGQNRVTPNKIPVHDQTSHYRSALEYFAVNDPRAPRRQRSEGQRFTQASQKMDW